MAFQDARVAWTEGMFLRPQHFQQQERFLEWLLHARLEQLFGFGHGFTEIAFDDGLRRQGKLALRSARGVLPDGTPFLVRAGSSQIPPLHVEPGSRDQKVYLTAVAATGGPGEFAMEDLGPAGRQRARYLPVRLELADSTRDVEELVDVNAGAVALELRTENGLDGTMTRLQVALVRERATTGEVILEDSFIPAMLDAMAFPRFRAWIEELYGLARQRGNMLEARIAQQGSRSVPDYLLLQTCNRYEPLLAQWRSGLPVHPRMLFDELLKLAGECRTSDAKSRRVVTLPKYAHEDPAGCFEPVVEEIRRQLVSVPDQTAEQIQVVDEGEGYYRADIPDIRMIRSGRLVIGIAASLPDATIRSELPNFVRIGAPDRIRALIMAQYFGIRLDLLPGAPIEIQYHAGFQYFQLDPQSEEWAHIEPGRRLKIFVAGEPPGLQLELWAIRPDVN